jgi:hypothetical protein
MADNRRFEQTTAAPGKLLTTATVKTKSVQNVKFTKIEKSDKNDFSLASTAAVILYLLMYGHAQVYFKHAFATNGYQ